MTTLSETSDLRDAGAFHKGDRVRKARELAGYAEIREFSAVTGLDRGALGRYESTGVIPRRGTLTAIALATKVRVDWLETGLGPMYADDDNPDGDPEKVPNITDRLLASRDVIEVDFTQRLIAA